MKVSNLCLVAFSTSLTVNAGCVKEKSESMTNSRPNVIYIFPDQFRNDACGFWRQNEFKEFRKQLGDPTITPNLNKFAKESLVLSHAQSNNPVSSPHRAMLMTGMYSAEKDMNGVPINCNTDCPYSSLNPKIETIGDVLSRAGYDCGYIGKYHLDAPSKNDPNNPGNYVDTKHKLVWDAYTPKELRHGFNYWFSYGTFDVHKEPHYWDNNGKKHEPFEYSPIYEAKKAIDYIRNSNNVRNDDKPFFLMIGMNPPHSPYQSLRDCMEEDYNLYKDVPLDTLLFRPNVIDRKMYKTKAAPYYFANVTGVDRAFGMILKALEEQGLKENTIVIFASDHGETLCSHAELDAKNMPYQEAMNIPFIVRYPKKIKHRVDNMLLSSPDIMPTILGLVGLSENIPSTVQGKDYSEIFLNDNCKMSRPDMALYFKNDNVVDEEGNGIGFFPVGRGIKTSKYTLAIMIDRNNNISKTYFYDDENDPYQLNNLPIEQNMEIYKMLVNKMVNELKRINDPWYKNGVIKVLY